MIYPGAFNTTTGPLHWDLLQRARYATRNRFRRVVRRLIPLAFARAIDNQFYVVMCSPARATTGDGYKAYGFSGVTDPMCVLCDPWQAT